MVLHSRLQANLLDHLLADSRSADCAEPGSFRHRLQRRLNRRDDFGIRRLGPGMAVRQAFDRTDDLVAAGIALQAAAGTSRPVARSLDDADRLVLATTQGSRRNENPRAGRGGLSSFAAFMPDELDCDCRSAVRP